MVLKPPSKALWAAELPRAAWMVATWWRHRALLASAPHGDGHAVMVLPGLFNTDRSNIVMRGFLRRLGYRAEGWGLGRNLGVRTVGADAERLIARVEVLAAESGPVTLIGVSLGGIMARLVAHRRPDLVRQVVTVSSPFAGDGRATNVWRAFEWVTGERLDDPAVIERSAAIAAPLSCPATAIWSRSDGLVAGAICRDEHGRSVEVRSGHLGVQLRPEVLVAVAEALAPVILPRQGEVAARRADGGGGRHGLTMVRRLPPPPSRLRRATSPWRGRIGGRHPELVSGSRAAPDTARDAETSSA